jgi:hypothetical protein
MKSYTFTQLSNATSPIGGVLNGLHISFSELTIAAQILVSNPKYVTLIRETTTPYTKGGGRTTGTLWHNKKVLGFTVEDAIREVKIQNQTAIPDTLEDPTKFNGIPANVYNIILSNYTGKQFILNSFYNGAGMRISSKSDTTGNNIYEKDVYTSDKFSPRPAGIAFDGAFIHHGDSEFSSSGCVIFSRTRNIDGKLQNDLPGVKLLNKYLQDVNLIGKGKFQQFNVLNAWELSDPPVEEKIFGTIISSDTNTVINGINIQTIPQ